MNKKSKILLATLTAVCATSLFAVIGCSSSHTHTYGDTAEWTWLETSSGYAAYASISCTSGDSTLTKTATVTSAVATAATCTTDGSMTYTATVTLNDVEYTDTKTVAITATGHTYDVENPVWTWTGYTSATVSFACASEDDTHTETATITSAVTTAATCKTKGVRTYTATATYNGVTYSDAKTEEIAVDDSNHANVETIAAVAATAYTDGNIAYYHCKDCDKYYYDAACDDEIDDLDDTIVPASIPLATKSEGTLSPDEYERAGSVYTSFVSSDAGYYTFILGGDDADNIKIYVYDSDFNYLAYITGGGSCEAKLAANTTYTVVAAQISAEVGSSDFDITVCYSVTSAYENELTLLESTGGTYTLEGDDYSGISYDYYVATAGIYIISVDEYGYIGVLSDNTSSAFYNAGSGYGYYVSYGGSVTAYIEASETITILCYEDAEVTFAAAEEDTDYYAATDGASLTFTGKNTGDYDSETYYSVYFAEGGVYSLTVSSAYADTTNEGSYLDSITIYGSSSINAGETKLISVKENTMLTVSVYYDTTVTISKVSTTAYAGTAYNISDVTLSYYLEDNSEVVSGLSTGDNTGIHYGSVEDFVTLSDSITLYEGVDFAARLYGGNGETLTLTLTEDSDVTFYYAIAGSTTNTIVITDSQDETKATLSTATAGNYNINSATVTLSAGTYTITFTTGNNYQYCSLYSIAVAASSGTQS